MKNAPAFSLALALLGGCSLTRNGHAGQGIETILFAPRPLKVEQDPTPYYPEASKRAKETGKVILRFRIGEDGMAQEPFVVDEANSTSAPRLIKAAKQLFQHSRYDTGKHYRNDVTASVLFEIMPCGKLQQASGFDYYYHLCIAPLLPIPDAPHF